MIEMADLPDKLRQVSVLVPISERYDDLGYLFEAHTKALEELQVDYEFIFVLDGCFPKAEESLRLLQKKYPGKLKLLKFSRSYGEAKALAAAFSESSGDLILTLSSYLQVQPTEIKNLFASLSADDDMIVGSRYPRRDSLLNRVQARMFNWIIRRLTNESFHDVSCGVRLIRREVLEDIELYGDLHRFIPLLAIQKGFRVREMPLAQACEDCHLRLYSPGVYWRRLLDVLTVFFLFKFTHKPLRFFGLLGSSIGMAGLLIILFTSYQRFVFHQALSDRPAFLIGVLISLVGLQTFFIGLVGEIIIFTHMSSEPGYKLEKIIE